MMTKTAAEPADDYLYNRAEQELEQAQRATHPAAVKAHYQMASHYLDLYYGADGAEAALRGGAVGR